MFQVHATEVNVGLMETGDSYVFADRWPIKFSKDRTSRPVKEDRFATCSPPGTIWSGTGSGGNLPNEFSAV